MALSRVVAMTLASASLATGACGPRSDAPRRGPADVIENPRPVRLVRPPSATLSLMAQLGRAIFYDSALSASGRLSCASCHQFEKAYGPPAGATTALAIARGEGHLARAAPSLRYAFRVPAFLIGPDASDVDEITAPPPTTGQTVSKVAGAARPESAVPRGGFFWDGRANTLQEQALGPLFNAQEMANRNVGAVSAKLRAAAYAPQFVKLFGSTIFDDPARAVDDAAFAVSRFQIEDPSFHPYDSKYDQYLEGNAALTVAEWRGLQAFEDPKRGNCAACHLDRPRRDGLPPMLTDFEYEALGVPSDTTPGPARDRGPVDLGACGPLRHDLASQVRYCGLFRTPSLRNVATRTAFFHNGVYRTLEQVLAFYNFRDTRPALIYPPRPGQTVERFDDLPPAYRGNVDTIDAPFDRKRGGAPPMSAQDMRDIIAFLHTLTDGYRAPERQR